MIPGNFPDIDREQAYPTPFRNSSLLHLLLLSLATQKHTPATKSSFQGEYDYIVVGAGTGGSVVASRLSEVESVTVLLLEAGPSPPLLTEVPAISGAFLGTDISWVYVTEPQKYTAQLHGNMQILYPRGKTIGGSSVINQMMYIRGSPEDYNQWEAQGAQSWNWRDAFKYFLKAEDNRDPEFLRNSYHAAGGPMTVERFSRESPFLNASIEAQSALAYPYIDPNGPTQVGAYDYQGNLRNGQRCSTAKGYLVPAENRTNLDIVAEAFVTKILIKGKRTRSVRFDHKESCYEIRVRREVIISAGAFNTPQLLMLSGIGPKKTLKKFGIPLVVDLPVGKNLHTHVGPIAFSSVSSDMPSFFQRLKDPKNIMMYINSRKGVLASSEIVFGLSGLKDELLNPPYTAPDYHIYFFEVRTRGIQGGLSLSPKVYAQAFAPYENKTILLCSAQILSPRSRGYVSLKSTDPYEQPLIQPNYLQDPEDARLSVSGLKQCYKILESPEMQSLGVETFKTVIPGCEEVYDHENVYLECSARAFAIPAHAVGTAKMGDPNDPTTVVDPELKVKGIKGLRVVDGSIMPVVPRANTNNVVIMIAEKAADLIKADIWQRWIKEIAFY